MAQNKKLLKRGHGHLSVTRIDFSFIIFVSASCADVSLSAWEHHQKSAVMQGDALPSPFRLAPDRFTGIILLVVIEV